MADPQTSNILLAVPTRGSDAGTWDVPVNGDFSSIDGHFGGIVTISLSNAPVTLTSPTGTPTPTPGPTQAENAVVRLTGTLTANVTVTLPLPGPIIIENLTTGNFVVTLRAVGSGEVIATAQGTRKTVYNDGTNVRFVNGPDPGTQEFWAGLTDIPAWVAACTVKPWLRCDGAIYNMSDFPYLGARLGDKFGGNGSTTFGVEDLGGRVPLAYDQTGTRITTDGCGINGQTIGASGGAQTNTLITDNLPPYTPDVTLNDPGHDHNTSPSNPIVGTGSVLRGSSSSADPTGPVTLRVLSNTTGITLTINPQGGTSTPVNNVQPAQVVGIWVVKT